MVVPVAIAAGKRAAPVAKKAAENPAGSLFLMVLVGAVAIQGLKNLPKLGDFLLGKVPGVDTAKAVYGAGKESVLETWEMQDEINQSFETITPPQDPIEKAIFGSFTGALGPEDEEQFGFWQTGYRGAREGLFTGFSSPWAPW